ncbi:uncharacterized protein ASCRUDRAFT_144411 [Ascoidea rubescens DSM 1968]|uniref:Uncharacterized protein n=1 Tax=Ascoidea rubescens DSM 1968 TaxID=1344418 RepID=A0A1D2VJ89_9ASCO|nr:hypothetical protein ASCRUDRAFT_144411 [Ascoidea rubescens DSM 1968]ODV61698.1 hypothetical protein ASCRUDRAFT_144411 [Ascoidea rubescens DSM 1968]
MTRFNSTSNWNHRNELNNTTDNGYENDTDSARSLIVHHILPSFQMYETFISYRNNFIQMILTSDTTALEPPTYSLGRNEVASNIAHTSNLVNQAQIARESIYNKNNADGGDQASVEYLSNFIEPFEPAGDIDNNSTVLFDNIGNFKEKTNSSLCLELFLTKSVPKLDKLSKFESPFKEFTSGDPIYGFIIIENKSSKDISFQNFYVSLEGKISTVNHDHENNIILLTTKHVLQMLDLSASWSFGSIVSSYGAAYTWSNNEKIGIERTIIGLPNNRVLKAKTKYKKFFYFKFPFKLLDTICNENQISSHLNLPPTLGVNLSEGFKTLHNESNSKNTKFIQVDPILGASKYSEKSGSTIVVNDYNEDNTLSVSYSINPRFVGFDSSVDQNSSYLEKFFILSKDEYNIRFIPSKLKTDYSGDRIITKAVEFIEEFNNYFNELKNIVHFISDKINQMESELVQQTRSGKSMDDKANKHCLYSSYNSKIKKDFVFDENYLEFKLSINEVVVKNFFFEKLHSIQYNDYGSPPEQIIVQAKVPNYELPYICPELLIFKNDHLKTLSNNFYQNENLKIINFAILVPNIKDDESKEKFTRFPKISDFKIDIVCINLFSSQSLPLNFCHFLFLGSNYIELKKMFQNLDERIAELTKVQQKEIPANIVDYVEAIKGLKYKVHAIENLISIVNISESENGDECDASNIKLQRGWKRIEQSNEWKKNFEVVWKFKSRNRITDTIIPDFQSCLISRFYFIKVSFGLNNKYRSAFLLPINVSKKDN